VPHQSCLLLTSREAPPELGVMIGGVRHLIGGQIERLSKLKRELLRWLGIET
jgi:hypothetical protein